MNVIVARVDAGALAKIGSVLARTTEHGFKTSFYPPSVAAVCAPEPCIFHDPLSLFQPKNAHYFDAIFSIDFAVTVLEIRVVCEALRSYKDHPSELQRGAAARNSSLSKNYPNENRTYVTDAVTNHNREPVKIQVRYTA